MTVTVTQFRKELFQLAKKSMEGERVSFVWQGVVFSVTPENTDMKTKLDHLAGQPTVSDAADLDDAGANMPAEMEAEWRKDWAEL